MNIALSAVLISILLIPPVVFYLAFYIGKYPRAIPKISLFEGILGTAVISLFIHAIAITCIPWEIRFDILIKVLGGELKDVENKISNRDFRLAIISFCWYNFWLSVIMTGLGKLSRYVVIRKGWHLKYEILSLYNKWYLLFDGYINGGIDYDFVFIDVVTDTKEGSIIYSGFLLYFDLANGELDNIYLQDTLKRNLSPTSLHPLTTTSAVESQAYKVPGDIFCLAYKNIQNINVRFIKIKESNETSEDESPIL